MDDSYVYIIKQNSMNTAQTPELQDWVEKAKRGEEEGFNSLYNHLFDKIYRFIFYRVSNKEQAEDLTEEVFVKAFQKIANVAKSASFESWLYTIARNNVIDYYRSKQEVIPLEEVEQTLSYESNIIDALHLELEQKRLLALIKQLPTEQQIILKLKFFEDLNTAEIAELLHKPEGTIRVAQHRALHTLKALQNSHNT